MSAQDLVVRGTACAAFVLYVAALVVWKRRGWSRGLWTAGCFIFWLHVACAFQLVHHWSHAEALDATARQTFETTAIKSGSGLYLNYGFMLVWALDAAWWWLAAKSHEARSRLMAWMVQGFMAFLWLNATVVFGHGPARWLGVAACLLWAFQNISRPRCAHR